MELTEREKLFVEYYIQTFNPTKAFKAMCAKLGQEVGDGYASVGGSRMIRNDKVKATIEARIEEVETRLQWETDDVIEALIRVASGEEKDVSVMTRGKDNKVIRKEVKTKVSDRLKAIELLGKTKGMFIDKIDVPFTKDDLVININTIKSSKEAQEAIESKEEDNDEDD